MSTHKLGSQEWDDDTLTDLKAARDEDATEVIAVPLAQSAWDRRQVHQLSQVENVISYLAANINRPGDVLARRGAVILRAEPDASHAERFLGVRTDLAGTAAYLAEPLPEGAQPKALPAAKPKRHTGVAMHFQKSHAGTACGYAAGAASMTTGCEQVTCGMCKRTRAFRQATEGDGDGVA